MQMCSPIWRDLETWSFLILPIPECIIADFTMCLRVLRGARLVK